MIFNIKLNSSITQITAKVYEEDHEVVTYEDSHHLYVPVKLSEYYLHHTDRLMTVLRKLMFSINACIISSDNKILEVKKHHTHAYNHVLINTPVFLSYGDFISKFMMLSRSISHEERIILNRTLRDLSIEERILAKIKKGRIKLSFLELVKLFNLTFHATSRSHAIPICLPGGRVDKKDKTLASTLIREVKEELDLDITVNEPDTADVVYHNIFDKVNEKFYHNLIFLCRTPYTSDEIKEKFQKSFEIGQVFLSDTNAIRLRPLIKTFDRMKERVTSWD